MSGSEHYAMAPCRQEYIEHRRGVSQGQGQCLKDPTFSSVVDPALSIFYISNEFSCICYWPPVTPRLFSR
jgi:hypothetical protein